MNQYFESTRLQIIHQRFIEIREFNVISIIYIYKIIKYKLM